ncbi:MAG: restriction endonuclease subunit S [Pseudomonadota bacterium]
MKATKEERLVAELVSGEFDVATFVENFDVLVNVAGSAKHLKALVLKLAVGGALLATTDETADSLLSELQRERFRLAKNGVRIGEDSAPVTVDEVPYTIPPGWRWVRLRDFGGFLGGGTPAKSNAAFWSGPLPWVSPKDMKRPYIDDAEDHISTAAVAGSAVKLIPAHSILYVVRGMILAHSFPVAIATREVTINQDMKALVLAIPALSEFVLRSCQAARTRVLAKVERSSHGTCRLESEVVETLPIALPPLAEQKRIVARVDQLTALIDDLEATQTKKREVSARCTEASLDALTTAEGPEEFDAAWKRVAENWETLVANVEAVPLARRAILGLAFSGRLVRQIDSDEHAELIVERSQAKLSVIRSSRREARADVPSQIAPPLPSGWVACPWKLLGTSQNGRAFPSGDYSEQGIRLLRPGNLHVSGDVRWTAENTRYLPEHYAQEFPEFVVGSGELIMNLTAQSLKDDFLGRVCMTGARERCLLNQRQARLVPFEVDPHYLLWFSRSPFFRSFVDGLNKGTLIQHMFTSQLAEALVFVPPLLEQKRIVAKVEQLMKLCDDLEAKLRRAEDRASKLVEAVVQEMVA